MQYLYWHRNLPLFLLSFSLSREVKEELIYLTRCKYPDSLLSPLTQCEYPDSKLSPLIQCEYPDISITSPCLFNSMWVSWQQIISPCLLKRDRKLYNPGITGLWLKVDRVGRLKNKLVVTNMEAENWSWHWVKINITLIKTSGPLGIVCVEQDVGILLILYSDATKFHCFRH